MVLKVASEDRRPRLRNEARVIRKMAKEGIAVPSLLFDGTGLEGVPPFVVYEDVGGVNLKQALTGMDPAARAGIFREIGLIVRQVHGLEVDQGRCENHAAGWKTRSFRGFLTRFFKEDVREVGLVEPDLALELKSFFPSRLGLATEPDRLCLVHRDLQPQNFKLINGRELVLLDLETAMAGDPVLDLAVLQTTVFDREPGLREAFFRGYGVEAPVPEEKLEVYVFVMRTHFLAGAVRQNDLERFGRNRSILRGLLR